MKTIIVLFIVFISADVLSKETNDSLIDEFKSWHHLTEKCQNGFSPLDSPKYQDECEKLEPTTKDLKEKGWCIKEHSNEYYHDKYIWFRCNTASVNELSYIGDNQGDIIHYGDLKTRVKNEAMNNVLDYSTDCMRGWVKVMLDLGVRKKSVLTEAAISKCGALPKKFADTNHIMSAIDVDKLLQNIAETVIVTTPGVSDN